MLRYPRRQTCGANLSQAFQELYTEECEERLFENHTVGRRACDFGNAKYAHPPPIDMHTKSCTQNAV